MTEENITDIIKLIKWNFPDEFNTIIFESGREILTTKSIEQLHSILGPFILRAEVIFETDISGKIMTNIKPVSKKVPWINVDGSMREIEI